MADISSVTNHFPTHKEGFVTTLSSTISSGATTVPLTSTSGLTNGDVFVGLVKPGESGEQCFTGTVDTSGSQITGVKWTTGSNADHTAGSTVVDYVTSTSQNMQSKGILVEHNQDGTHSDVTATSVTTTGDITVGGTLTISGSASAEGWSALGNTLTYSSNDGNKQATYTITGVDKTDTIQEGMKVKLPRVTSVGTQCTDLEASSSQYASKSSPSGITFTDDFTCGAWVKVESLGASNEERTIISRYNASLGGFMFRVEDSTVGGQLNMVLGNGATTDTVNSYISVPLSKWVHVAMTINLSAKSYRAYINGALVENYEQDAPHTLSAIVQAGDLNIGAWGSANDYMDGKIKHAFVADKILSEAEVQEAMVSDDLTSASFSANLDAYFKLEGDFTDSSANGNDLTAQGGAVATDADSPFSSTEYGIITSASFSTDTTVTVFTGDGVAPNEDITAPSYSTHRVPYGFPAGKDKWKVEADFGSPNAQQTSPSAGTWYNIANMKLTVPIGSWQLHNRCTGYANHGSSTSVNVYTTLSSDGSTETDSELNDVANYQGATGNVVAFVPSNKSKDIELTASTTYTALVLTNTSGVGTVRQGNNIRSYIVAYCNYV